MSMTVCLRLSPLTMAAALASVAACANPGSSSSSAQTTTATSAASHAPVSQAEPPVTDVSRLSYAPATKVVIATMTKHPLGLYYQDVMTGHGPMIGGGMTATVRYTGMLPNGTVFDASSQHGNAPVTVVVGQHGVIVGWEVALAGMRPGGTRRVVIPPELGYASQPMGGIPANSTLVFEITALTATDPR
jgi:FKBP-type peptidyl-prolyl cis-trans isomerase